MVRHSVTTTVNGAKVKSQESIKKYLATPVMMCEPGCDISSFKATEPFSIHLSAYANTRELELFSTPRCLFATAITLSIDAEVNYDWLKELLLNCYPFMESLILNSATRRMVSRVVCSPFNAQVLYRLLKYNNLPALKTIIIHSSEVLEA